jgi:hypothetical protein
MTRIADAPFPLKDGVLSRLNVAGLLLDQVLAAAKNPCLRQRCRRERDWSCLVSCLAMLL